MKHLFLILVFSTLHGLIFSQANDLEYFRSIYPESQARSFVEKAYTGIMNLPVSETEFNSVRSKSTGLSFYDPNFGRKWTFIYDGGNNIMNSERNAWNHTGSRFFLPVNTGTGYIKLAIFDGATAGFLKHVNVTGVPSTSTAIRWLPGSDEEVFFFSGNQIVRFNIEDLSSEVFQSFASFTLTEKDVGGGDGNEVSPEGDMLVSNKGKNAFVYNFFEKKVVRMQDGQRVYFDPEVAFPTFSLGEMDYAIAFAGHIFELDEDGGGISLRDFNGSKKQSLYRRTPHMDPTYFRDGDKLYPGVFIRYNAADAGYYSSTGYPSAEGKAYFHAFDPNDPTQFVRFPMDSWESTVLGSGGQISANRFDGTTGIKCIHGPAKYDLDWEPRFGECFESAYFSDESENPRRFAHHYIGYLETFSASQQPEGWLSPGGDYAIIKTKWGWYKIELAERIPGNEVDQYLGNPAPETHTLTVNSGKGGGECVEGVKKNIVADPPPSNHVFDQWTGDTEHITDIYSNETTLIMPAKDVSVTAVYKEKPKHSLNITIHGHGSVMVNPSGSEFYEGTMVALIATADESYEFLRWEQDLSSSSNPALVTIDADKQITAVFSDFPVSINPEREVGASLIKIFPNPASGFFQVELSPEKAETYTINIFNLSGQPVYSQIFQQLPPGTQRLDFEPALESGFYLIDIQSNTFSYRERILLL